MRWSATSTEATGTTTRSDELRLTNPVRCAKRSSGWCTLYQYDVQHVVPSFDTTRTEDPTVSKRIATRNNLKIYLHLCVRTPSFLCTYRKLEAIRSTYLVKYLQTRFGFDLCSGLYPIFICRRFFARYFLKKKKHPGPLRLKWCRKSEMQLVEQSTDTTRDTSRPKNDR